ncbi:MAG: glycosyltransferase family 4 protein [bacterium]
MKKNIKIAQVVCILPPLAGGIGMVAHSYADQLTRRDYAVTIFAPRQGVDMSEDKSYKVVALFPWLKIGLGAIMPQLLWRLWRYDIVHFHYPLFGSALIVALLKKIRGNKMKLIISYHMDVNLEGWRRLYEIICRNLFLDFILNKADKIIVSSEDYIENSIVQNYYFQHVNKFVELPFGVPKAFSPASKNSSLLQKHGLAPDDKIVMFVGGLGPAHYFKGINFLIKAISFIDDKKIKALIVGGGSLLPHYKKIALKFGVSERIKFTDYVPAELLIKYYNLADVFILPSINSSEAFGIVLIEAMACGKPVIASNLKGVRSVVDPGVNGLLVEPKNSRDIAEKIKYLFEHPEKIQLFSHHCLDSVAGKYRWAVITDKLESVYNKLF